MTLCTQCEGVGLLFPYLIGVSSLSFAFRCNCSHGRQLKKADDLPFWDNSKYKKYTFTLPVIEEVEDFDEEIPF